MSTVKIERLMGLAQCTARMPEAANFRETPNFVGRGKPSRSACSIFTACAANRLIDEPPVFVDPVAPSTLRHFSHRNAHATQGLPVFGADRPATQRWKQ